ncbi:HisA/HisF-related TIM barrel protein [Candidatus Hodgkinia cicadicola]|uniref:HisA/HisF-related TIM barrel protein n=1 Tax=Candidatus Hodgkinia cicadicola TaxID=573658 RepID=UPI0011BABC21
MYSTISGLRSTGIDVSEHERKLAQHGVGGILLTSIDKDGTNNVYDTLLLKSISQHINVPVITFDKRNKFRLIISVIIEGNIPMVLLISTFHYDKQPIPQLKYFSSKDVIYLFKITTQTYGLHG